MTNYLKTIYNFFEKERHLIAASIARIGLGSVISLYYLLHVFQRHYYWGPNGVYPFEDFKEGISMSGSFSLYQLSESIIYFDTIFFIGACVAILYTIGFQPRVTGIINFIFIWSLYERNQFVLDGGNNILIICLFFLLFANVGAYFSFTKSKKSNNRFIAALHNVSIAACVIQISILYFFSGFFKAQGDMWANGISLYYILQVNEFTLPGIGEFIYSNPLLLTLGTLSTIVIQLAFPFLIIHTSTRWIIVMVMVMFHLGIIVLMGLFSFGFTMIILDLLVLNDNHYRRFYSLLQRLLNKLKLRTTVMVEDAS